MKVFCLTCKKHILDTSDQFVCGGPYNGAMFISGPGMPVYSKYPRNAGVVKANLQCPWCGGIFCGVKGELLTEHGKIHPGQKEYDPSFNIVWQDGPAKGRLMYIKDSVVMSKSVERRLEIQTATDNDSTMKAFAETLNIPKADEIAKNIEIAKKSCEEEIKASIVFDAEIITDDIVTDPKDRARELKKTGMTQKNIAKELGVSTVTVWKWLKEAK